MVTRLDSSPLPQQPRPTAQRVYAMLANESLWDTAQRCHEALQAANIPHAVVGGIAVCLHGYQRNTVDLDLLVRKEDSDLIRTTLAAANFVWNVDKVEFTSPLGTPVQFLLAGDRAGKGSEVFLPDPGNEKIVKTMEGLPVLTLARLIESKIACGQGNLRRTHKDFADVIELVAVNNLNSSFARYLHKSLRATFRELVQRARTD
jgi:hypothetical protein